MKTGFLYQVLIILSLFNVMNLYGDWEKTYSGTSTVLCIAADGSHVFFGTQTDGVYRSSDNGMTWQSFRTGLPDSLIYAIAMDNTSVFCAPRKNAIYYSAKDGTQWASSTSNGLSFTMPNYSVSKMLSVEGNLLHGSVGGIYLSNDDAGNWNRLNNRGINDLCVGSNPLSQDVFKMFAVYSEGVFVSTDNGESWIMSKNEGLDITSATCCYTSGNSTVFIGTYGNGLFRSNDDGDNWVQVASSIPDSNILSLTGSGDAIYIGTMKDGIYHSIDEGNSWNECNNGLPDPHPEAGREAVVKLAISGESIIAGIGADIWVTSRTNASINAPTAGYGNTPMSSIGVLYSRYENQTISFSLRSGKSGFVKLRLVDIAGRDVIKPVTSYLSRGHAVLRVGTNRISKGIYYGKIIMNNSTDEKKVILY